MRVTRMVGGIAILATFGGCLSVNASYSPPPIREPQGEFTVTVDKSFDETWNAIIDFAGRTYFGIDAFEKASGLMTLTFGAGQPSEFITGGHWTIDYSDTRTAQGQRFKFDGDYVDYAQQQNGGSLLAKMNVIARPDGDQRTTVMVNTRYVFSTQPHATVQGTFPGHSWAFTTGSSATIQVSNATQGTPPTRTMRPTHKAERDLIEAVKKF